MPPEEIPLLQPEIPEDFATREFIEASEGNELTQQAIELMGEVRELGKDVADNSNEYTDGFVKTTGQTVGALEKEFNEVFSGEELEDLRDFVNTVPERVQEIEDGEQDLNMSAKHEILMAKVESEKLRKKAIEKLTLTNASLPNEIRNIIGTKVEEFLTNLYLNLSEIDNDLDFANNYSVHDSIINITGDASREIIKLNEEVDLVGRNLNALCAIIGDIFYRNGIGDNANVQAIKKEIITSLQNVDIKDPQVVTAFDDFEKDIVIAQMADQLETDSEKLFSIISAIAENRELSEDDKKIADAYRAMIDNDSQFKLFAEEVTPKIPEAKRILTFTADGKIDESVPNDPKIKEAVQKTIKLKSYALGGWKDVNKKLADNMGIKEYDEMAFMERVKQLQRDAGMPENQVDGKIGPITSRYLAKQVFKEDITVPLGEMTAWQNEETPDAPTTQAA